MRRMPPKPMELIECEHVPDGSHNIVYVPIMSLDELPVKFDLIVPNRGYIIPVFAYESYMNGEVYAFGTYTTIDGFVINVTCEPDSIIRPKSYPKLTLNVDFVRGDKTELPIDITDKVFMANLVHMPKLPIIDF